MSRLLFLLLLLAFQSSLTAQECNGNLGENIFEEGDFGEGAANIVQNDPNIAPGYTYTTVMPPNDGFYTITNDMTQWSWAFDWIEIQDNSNNPDGYMMVVNASFDPGVFYTQTVDDLCDGTLYEFSADIFNLLNPGANNIKPNVSFAIDGVVQYSTGEVSETNQWQTFGFTFETAPGQTSVTLSLLNNAPGGQGNDLALDNITFRACGDEALILPDEIANICEDGSNILLDATVIGTIYANPAYQWQQSFDGGMTWVNIAGANGINVEHTDLTAGMYYYRYLLADGAGNLASEKCRVQSNIKVINVIPKETFMLDTLCSGLALEFGGESYTETGTYTQDLLNFLGCDSIITLDLTIVPDPDIQVSLTTSLPGCSNTLDGSIEINNIFNGTAPYTVFVDGIELTAGTDLFDIPASDYSYLIEDAYGCTFDTLVSLQPSDPFTIDLGEDVIVELGDFIDTDISATQDIVSYFWAPDNYVDCEVDCDGLSFAPPYSTNLSLVAIDENGCTATDTVSITVETVRKVYIPNAFSPNFDGVNDEFVIQTAFPNVQQVNHLRIFDRWGNLVFENANFLPNNPKAGWNGTHKGNRMNTGIYTYTADLLFLDGAVERYDGNVLLIR